MPGSPLPCPFPCPRRGSTDCGCRCGSDGNCAREARISNSRFRLTLSRPGLCVCVCIVRTLGINVCNVCCTFPPAVIIDIDRHVLISASTRQRRFDCGYIVYKHTHRVALFAGKLRCIRIPTVCFLAKNTHRNAFHRPTNVTFATIASANKLFVAARLMSNWCQRPVLVPTSKNNGKKCRSAKVKYLQPSS